MAAERILSRRTRVSCFRPGAVFAFVRWTSNDFGTIHSNIAIAMAVAPGEPYATLPFVRPGAEILSRIDGWPKVQKVLAAKGDCSTIDWSFLGLTMPMWSLVWFVLLAVWALWIGFRARRTSTFR